MELSFLFLYAQLKNYIFVAKFYSVLHNDIFFQESC